MEAFMTTLYGVLILIIMVGGLLWPCVDLWTSSQEEDFEGLSPMTVNDSSNPGESHV